MGKRSELEMVVHRKHAIEIIGGKKLVEFVNHYD